MDNEKRPIFPVSEYLKPLGVKEDDLPQNWNPEDCREKHWKLDREKHGFDERETWSLDYTFVVWAYPRLKMYNEVNYIDTSYHTFDYKGTILTEQQCIDRILEGLEVRIKGLYPNKEDSQKMYEAYELFALVLPSLWW